MPFLPLFIGQLGVTDVGEIAMWTGLSLGVTPRAHALHRRPLWGTLGDRFGRKIMVERSLVSFVVAVCGDGVRAQRRGRCSRCARIQGLFAGYGSLSVAMAAESAPRDRMPSAIGAVQTAQRIGPGVGPVIGGLLASLVGLPPRVRGDRALLPRRPGDRPRHVRRSRHRMRSRRPQTDSRPRHVPEACWPSATSSS